MHARVSAPSASRKEEAERRKTTRGRRSMNWAKKEKKSRRRAINRSKSLTGASSACGWCCGPACGAPSGGASSSSGCERERKSTFSPLDAMRCSSARTKRKKKKKGKRMSKHHCCDEISDVEFLFIFQKRRSRGSRLASLFLHFPFVQERAAVMRVQSSPSLQSLARTDEAVKSSPLDEKCGLEVFVTTRK